MGDSTEPLGARVSEKDRDWFRAKAKDLNMGHSDLFNAMLKAFESSEIGTIDLPPELSSLQATLGRVGEIVRGLWAQSVQNQQDFDALLGKRQSSFDSEVSKLKEDRDKLAVSLRELSEPLKELETVKARVAELELNESKLNAVIRERDEQLKDLPTLKAQAGQASILSTELKDRKDEIATLQEKYADYDKQKANSEANAQRAKNFEQQLVDFKKEFVNLTEKYKDYDEIKSSLITYTSECAKFKERSEQQEQRLKQYEQELMDAKNELKDLKIELKEIGQLRGTLLSKNQELEIENADLKLKLGTKK